MRYVTTNGGSVGGLTDVAEIKGHRVRRLLIDSCVCVCVCVLSNHFSSIILERIRVSQCAECRWCEQRTYVGSMPGKLIQVRGRVERRASRH